MRQKKVLNKAPPEITSVSDMTLYDYEEMKGPDLDV